MSSNEFDPPSIGDIVFVECESTEYEFPFAHGKTAKGLDSNPSTPQKFQREVPTNRGFQSPGGHSIEFDDGISIPTTDPNISNSTTQNKGVRITTSAGNKIFISEDNDNSEKFILLEDVSGNLFKMDYENNIITLTDTENIVEIDKNAETITSTNKKGKIFKLDTHQTLGQGLEPVVLGETLFDMLDDFLTDIIIGITPGSPGHNAASLIEIRDAATTLQGILATFKSTNSRTD